MTLRPFILCADDFALSPHSTQGILTLLEKSRLSAVSAIVNMPDWPQASQSLLFYRQHIDIGLHFNLTEGPWLSRPHDKNQVGLNTLLLQAYTGQLSTTLIREELQAQLDAFVKAMGHMPDFIDGHQHIQQLPVIRQTLLAWFNQQQEDYHPYLRCSYLENLRGNNSIKRWIINRLGASTLKKQLASSTIRHNHTFSGVYDFSPNANYRQYFQGFLGDMKKYGMIMCHPAYGHDTQDPHTQARQNEWAYFNSDAFMSDCKTAGLYLSRGDFL